MGRRKQAPAPEPAPVQDTPAPVEKSVSSTDMSSFIISEADATAFVSTLGVAPSTNDNGKSTMEVAVAGEALLRSPAPENRTAKAVDADALPSWLVDEPLGTAVDETPMPMPKRRGRPPKSLSLLSPAPEPEQAHVSSSIVPAGRSDTATIINKIIFELNTFGPLLEPFHNNNVKGFTDGLYKRSAGELDALLAVMVKHRTVANLSNQLKHLVFVGASFIEMSTKAVGMASDGYANALKQQESEISMILKELALEKADQWSGAQRPEIRLGMLLSSTLLAVDTSNRIAKLNARAPADAQAKYGDL